MIEVESNLNTVDIGGSTPIHLAVENNRADLLESMLSKNAQIIDSVRKEHPLVLAIQKQATKCVELLIEHRASVNVSDKQGPLVIFSFSGNRFR